MPLYQADAAGQALRTLPHLRNMPGFDDFGKTGKVTLLYAHKRRKEAL